MNLEVSYFPNKKRAIVDDVHVWILNTDTKMFKGLDVRCKTGKHGFENTHRGKTVAWFGPKTIAPQVWNTHR